MKNALKNISVVEWLKWDIYKIYIKIYVCVCAYIYVWYNIIKLLKTRDKEKTLREVGGKRHVMCRGTK